MTQAVHDMSGCRLIPPRKVFLEHLDPNAFACITLGAKVVNPHSPDEAKIPRA
jgi:hypothetical protein